MLLLNRCFCGNVQLHITFLGSGHEAMEANSRLNIQITKANLDWIGLSLVTFAWWGLAMPTKFVCSYRYTVYVACGSSVEHWCLLLAAMSMLANCSLFAHCFKNFANVPGKRISLKGHGNVGCILAKDGFLWFPLILWLDWNFCQSCPWRIEGRIKRLCT